MRVFAVSDIHADYPQNLAWVHSLSATAFQEDVLILAGDVSDDLNILTEVLSTLRAKFSQLLFVPGNHELWLEPTAEGDSLQKFHAILELCAQEGVVSRKLAVGKVTLVPLYSWYDYSFGDPDSYLRRAWKDFRRCRWPQELMDEEAINQYFLAHNEPCVSASNEVVISYSHFMPRLDLMPTQIPTDKQRVYPVLGSWLLDKQIRALGAQLHVYGHSHVNRDVRIEGIRYVNNAFAYPAEARIARKRLYCVYDDHRNASPKLPNKPKVPNKIGAAADSGLSAVKAAANE